MPEANREPEQEPVLGRWYIAGRDGATAMFVGNSFNEQYPAHEPGCLEYVSRSRGIHDIFWYWTWEPNSAIVALGSRPSGDIPDWGHIRGRVRPDGHFARVFWDHTNLERYVIIAGCHKWTAFEQARHYWAQRELNFGTRFYQGTNLEAWSIAEMNQLEFELKMQQEPIHAPDPT